ncbi:hypothetical protein JTB14_036493 [Gonioctena quinquepunctata]|nr:hypothetical protein JTB14_036493 [Gonioctena quinquepunctata]
MLRGRTNGRNISESTSSNISRTVSGNTNNGLFEITTQSPARKQFLECDLGFQDENLDFEPEGEAPYSNSNHTQNSLNTSPYASDSSVGLWQSTPRSDESSNARDLVDNQSVLSSHRGEMIRFKPNVTEDGRHKEYINIPYDINFSTTTTLLDSSSSGSDGIAVNSHQESLSQEDLPEGGSISQEDEPEYSDAGYDVTSDEENKLLKSSSESSMSSIDNDEPQAFYNKAIHVPENKNIRITAYVDRNNKLKMWNRSYRPYPPPVRLFLDDIGYEPCTSSESSSDCSSMKYEPASSIYDQPQSAISVHSIPKSAVSPSRRPSSEESLPVNTSSFRVTVNLSQGNRQVEKPTISISSFAPSTVSSDQFKMPLPPAKRPPTRPRRSNDGSTSKSSTGKSSMSSKIEMISKKKKKEDDAISIVASSLGGGDIVDNLDVDLQDNDNIKDETLSQSAGPGDCFDTLYDKSYVEKWIEKIPSPEQSNYVPSIPPLLSFQLTPLDMPPQQSTGCPLLPSSTGRMRFNFRDVPKFFQGLCYHYYFSESCTSNRCQLPHSVAKEKFSVKCKNLQREELKEMYLYTLRFHTLFKDIYRCFIIGFSHHNMQKELVSCISDFLSPSITNLIDSTNALDHTIQALERTGLAFLEAIDMISYNVGFINHPPLANILVELLSRKDNIEDNWDTIKRISRAMCQISPIIVSTILNRVASVYPPNKPLCVNIYNFIVNDKMTDLSCINEDLIKPLKIIVRGDNAVRTPPVGNLTMHIENNLSRERERFERTCSPPVFNDTASRDSDERFIVPFANQNGANQSFTPSPTSSKRRGFGSYGLGVEPLTNLQEVNRYVPQTTVRRSAGTQQLTNAEYETALPTTEPPHLSNRPIFGCPRYRPTYKMDVSLHNLLSDSNEMVCLHENDVVKLNDAIKNTKAKEFLSLLDLYKGVATVKNFVTMTVAHLKGLHGNQRISDCIFGLLDSLAVIRPDYMKETHIKGILEVVVFNLLFFLEKRCNWRDARKLLETFYDWDSLISSQMFALKKVTHMGRYIFLAKLLNKADCYHLTYEILQCPNLHLLENCDAWPFFYFSPFDMESRNSVLDDFFSVGYRHNVVFVADMYRQVFTSRRIHGYDVLGPFKKMMISLINEEKILSLKYFRSEVFYKQMDRSVLRSFTIIMHGHMTLEEQCHLYELCCHKNIHSFYTGRETDIAVRTNMPDGELRLVLDYFFYKLSKIGAPPTADLSISIRLPEGPLPSYPAVLQRSVRSIDDINNSIRSLMQQFYGITSSLDVHSTVITIGVDQIRDWLLRVRNRNTLIFLVLFLQIFKARGSINICWNVFKHDSSHVQTGADLEYKESNFVDHFVLNFTHPAISIYAILDNLTLSNLTNLQPSINKDNQILNLTFPNITIEGVYDLKGNIGDLFDIFGNGTFWMHLLNFSIGVTIEPYLKGFSVCANTTVNIDLQQFQIQLNDFMADEELGELMNKAFCSIVPEILRVLWEEEKEDKDEEIEKWINSIINGNPDVSALVVEYIKKNRENVK